jgi:5'-nucleotidase / UDP-sugar diphosphatase
MPVFSRHAARRAGRILAATGPALLLSACLIQVGGFSWLDGDVLATAEQTFCQRRVPGPTRDTSRSALGDACNLAPRVVAQGGDMQQWVAHALLERAKLYGPADASLVNGGGVRTDFPGLDAYALAQAWVTVEEARAVLPFRNGLLRLTLTGSQLHTALEDGLDHLVRTPGATGGYPYLAGVRFHVDLAAARGARVSNLQRREPSGQWVALAPGTILRLVTSSYLAGAGDGYDTLAGLPPAQREDLGLEETAEFVAFVAARPSFRRLPASEYSTQSFRE